jgi:hypothetical protein
MGSTHFHGARRHRRALDWLAALLLEDARALFAPVIGMVGGLAGMTLTNHQRLKLRMDALEKRLAHREVRSGSARRGKEWWNPASVG